MAVNLSNAVLVESNQNIAGTKTFSSSIVLNTAPTAASHAATKEYVDSKLGGLIPSGVITMWSGAIGSIPSGWALCNGANGTPDLRNRFVVGAGSTYAIGATGGADTVTLTVAQMPAHAHTATDAGHAHSIQTKIGLGVQSGKSTPCWVRERTVNTGLGYARITVQAAGGGAAHENRPPYYALAYIMKL